MRSRKSDNDKSDLVKTGEKMGIKKENPLTQTRNSSTGFRRHSTSKGLKTAEGSSAYFINFIIDKPFFIVVSLVDKNMLYFTRRKRMKRKVTKTVSLSFVHSTVIHTNCLLGDKYRFQRVLYPKKEGNI